jgi:hypothetical protein
MVKNQCTVNASIILADIIEAAIRDVKTAAGTGEQKDEAEELRHLASQQ